MSAPSASFDYQFENPEDAKLTWGFDPMHAPHPLPALSQDVMRGTMAAGMDGKAVFVNGYPFTAMAGIPSPPAEVLQKGALRAWEDYVPEIAATCREIREHDYASMSAVELAASLEGILRRASEAQWRTMVVVVPFMMPTMKLMQFAEDTLGADGPLLVGTLLQGHANKTSEAAVGLARLTQLAAGLPAVAAALRQQRFSGLAALEGGPAFLEALHAYLAEYGWRTDDWSAAHVATWAEDHAKPLALISAYLRDESRSPEVALTRAVEQRTEAERSVRERLVGEAAERFWELFAVAAPHVAISESRAMWQLTITGSLRAPLMACGEKLQRSGTLEDAADVFYLSLDEIAAAAADPGPTHGANIPARKAQLHAWRDLTPPPFIGAPPSAGFGPPEGNAIMRRFMGIGMAPSKDPSIIKGHAACKGTVRGTARVIRELADAGRLEPGDILVCITTAPPWTPLFAVAGGVVTDTGGVLSHSAICAREFGIPCVVGTVTGTAQIPDGATITVDGAAGEVRLG